MAVFAVRPPTTDLKVRDASGEWISADALNAPRYVRLLDNDNTILGKLYTSLKDRLSKENSLSELAILLDEGDRLMSKGSAVLCCGISLLFDSHRKELHQIILDTPERWPHLSPYLLRDESSTVRERCLAKILAVATQPGVQIEACRHLRTPLGVSTLLALIESGSFAASNALAMMHQSEIPESMLQRISQHTAKFPALNTVLPQSPIDSAVGNSIKRSFLLEGITFSGRRCTLNFNDPAELYTTGQVMIEYASHALKERRDKPTGTMPEERLRNGAHHLFSSDHIEAKLRSFHEKEIPLLFSTLGLPESSDELIQMATHDRCAVELHLDEGHFEQAFLKYLGKWHWIAQQIRNGTHIDTVISDIKARIQHGEPFTVGEVIGARGQINFSDGAEISSLDALQSLSPNLKEDEILGSETAAYHRGLPSVGIEIQNLEIPEHLFYPWKDYLASHGIRSAWRPEFSSQVEASLPPFYNVDHIDEIVTALHGRGFLKTNRLELGVHVSIATPNVPDLKYVALGIMSMFPPLFDSQQSDTAWEQSLGSLMSKGFIYENPGTLRVHHSFPHHPSHTEIRVIAVRNNMTPLMFKSRLIEALRAAQHWTSVIERAPFDERCAEALTIYKRAIAESLPPTCRSLLEMNWNGGTGDPYDNNITRTVPSLDGFKSLRRASITGPDEVSLMFEQIAQIFQNTSAITSLAK